ncbi:hypothetical protein RV134_320139 [Roseovarius sp. EC-HK134]|uniref:hypothetical protein n=1 Tax=unclassified Roseovarius TaxID=2614913 RepID=UPI001254779A|nr:MULTISPECIES: hypothetical protein [unclassified Roseovarius]VVT23266.1 hypothetical protein RV420_380068 [Roseovarius sp. EC-SD190]VVT23467.1 hypothetical protein RV134_320139 [Roseovarius sp. EC-HK134]
MAIHAKSGHPDWYIESLVAKYQYLAAEHARESAKRIINVTIIVFSAAVALLAYLAFGNVWSALLSVLLILTARRLELQNRRFQIAVQMLMMESEFPHIRENVALPTKATQ